MKEDKLTFIYVYLASVCHSEFRRVNCILYSIPIPFNQNQNFSTPVFIIVITCCFFPSKLGSVPFKSTQRWQSRCSFRRKFVIAKLEYYSTVAAEARNILRGTGTKKLGLRGLPPRKVIGFGPFCLLPMGHFTTCLDFSFLFFIFSLLFFFLFRFFGGSPSFAENFRGGGQVPQSPAACAIVIEYTLMQYVFTVNCYSNTYLQSFGNPIHLGVPLKCESSIGEAEIFL